MTRSTPLTPKALRALALIRAAEDGITSHDVRRLGDMCQRVQERQCAILRRAGLVVCEGKSRWAIWCTPERAVHVRGLVEERKREAQRRSALKHRRRRELGQQRGMGESLYTDGRWMLPVWQRVPNSVWALGAQA
jgi:hypothetical protein